GIRGEDLLPAVMPLERREMRRPYETLGLVIEARLARRRRQRLDERADGSREWGEAIRRQICDVRVVAAEELVSAFARKRHLDVLGRELGDEIRGKCGRVGERLVERLCKCL